MPIVEAMKCGVAVITSNNSSIPEVVGGSAIMINYNDENACIENFEKLYFDERLKNEYTEKSISRAKLFSWENTTERIIEIFNFVLLNALHLYLYSQR